MLIACLPSSFAQDFHQWGLPNGVKARIGKGWVTDMAFSPDGSRLAVASSIGIWIYDINTGSEAAFLNGHTEHVTSVSFSPDGKTLVSASSDWTIRIWDVNNKKHLRTLEEHSGPVNSVTYSPDGKTLASGGNDGIRLWNIENWQHKFIFRGRLANVSSIVYSPDGKTLASGGRDGRILLWDAMSGREKKVIDGHKRSVKQEYYSQYVTSVKYSPDGLTLASWSNNRLLLWDTVKGQSIPINNPYRLSVRSLAFSLDSNTIVTGRYDGTVVILDREKLTHKRSLPAHIENVTTIITNPNANIFASASLDGTIRLWGSVSNIPKRLFFGHTPSVADAVFSPDGKTLSSGGMYGEVNQWDVDSGEFIRTLSVVSDKENNTDDGRGHSWRSKFNRIATSIVYSPDGETIACGSMDNKIRMWRTNDGEYIRMLNPHTDNAHANHDVDDVRHVHSVTSLAYSPDGRILASGGLNGNIRLWNSKRGLYLQTLSDNEDPVTSISFAPDGRTFISSGKRKIINLWDAREWEHIMELKAGFMASSMSSVVFSPDGKTIVGACGDNDIYLWNSETGILRQKFSGHTEWVTSVTFSPDGTVLASSSNDRTIRLWDATTGKIMQKLSGHMNSINSIAYSPDGNTLASTSNDGTILLWNLPTKKQNGTHNLVNSAGSNLLEWNLPGAATTRLGKGPVNDIVFSPDGSRLAASSSIGTWIYNPLTGNEIALFSGPTSTKWITFSPDGNSLLGRSKRELYALDAMTGIYKYTISFGSNQHLTGHRPFDHSPDGKTLATWYGIIQLWDADTGEKKQTLHESIYSKSSAFSSDSTIIAYCTHSQDKSEKVQLWNVVKGKHKQTLSGHKYWVELIVYAPDGKTFASFGRPTNWSRGKNQMEIILWDAGTSKIRHRLLTSTSLNLIMYAPDSKTIVAGGEYDKRVYLWDVISGKLKHELTGNVPIMFAPDSRTIATVNGNTISIWDSTSSERLHHLTGHSEKITQLEYSPDGRIITSLGGFEGNEIRLWDVASGTNLHSIDHTSWVRSLVFSTDGSTIISGHTDKKIRVWDVESCKLKQTLFGYTTFNYSPDGRVLASASQDKTVRLWDVDNSKHEPAPSIISIPPGIEALAFSKDGSTLAIGIYGGTIKLFDAVTLKHKQTLTGHSRAVVSLVYSPDGNILASGSVDKTIRLWDGKTGLHKKTLIGHTNEVSSLVFSPDGKTLVSGDPKIRFWNVQTGLAKQVFSRHSNLRKLNPLAPATFSPNGKILATTGGQSSILLWNANTGKPIHNFVGHGYEKWLTSLIITPDGNRLASGSSDGTILLWDLPSNLNRSE